MDFIVEATIREKTGRNAVRALRRDGMVPAVIYGLGKPCTINCAARSLTALMQNEAFFSKVVGVRMEGKTRQVILREIQRHPVNSRVLHVDFQEISEDQEISTTVPLHFVGIEASAGVKLHHGIFNAIENQISVNCLPRNLPEYIEVDVSHLDSGDSIHLEEITPPKGVRFDEIIRGNNPALAVISEAATATEEQDTVTTAVDDVAVATETADS